MAKTVELKGTGFKCSDADCSKLMVRFGDNIFQKASMTSSNTITTTTPKYTRPDVLPVEVTFNGQDFTNDNLTYGYFDPFVLDI